MFGSLYIASQALGAGSIASAVTANNIANVNTQSFKSRMTSFADVYGGGVKIAGIGINQAAGSLVQSGSKYDVASYDRFSGDNRSFRLDPNAVNDGFMFTPLESANLTVDNEGFLYSNGAAIGQLNSVGGNTAPVITGEEFMQGYNVTSNVNIAKEMVDNNVNLAYFKMNASVVRTTDEMLGTLLSIKA